MRKVFYSISVFFVLLMIGCNQEKGLTISGNVSDVSNLKIHLYGGNMGEKPSVIMSKAIDSDGNFEIKLPTKPGLGVYNLKVGSKGIALPLDGSETNIVINGAVKGFPSGDFQVEGSPKTKEVYALLTDLRTKKITKEDFYEKMKQQDALIQYSLSGLVYGAIPQMYTEHQKVLDNVKKEYGESKLTKSYQAFINQLKNKYEVEMAKEKIKVGNEAPEIALPNPKGEIMKLSDYKGKLVLLDFWAAWCGPCRRNNPKLVKLYDQYNDQGFEIFSVSLDGSKKDVKPGQEKIQKARYKEKWVKAIKDDNLQWPGHVSDLKAWKSEAARTYGVRALPKTYLISKEGEILAINPHLNLEELIKANL